LALHQMGCRTYVEVERRARDARLCSASRSVDSALGLGGEAFADGGRAGCCSAGAQDSDPPPPGSTIHATRDVTRLGG